MALDKADRVELLFVIGKLTTSEKDLPLRSDGIIDTWVCPSEVVINPQLQIASPTRKGVLGETGPATRGVRKP